MANYYYETKPNLPDDFSNRAVDFKRVTKDIKDQLAGHLEYIQHRYSEEGDPGHIIQIEELAKAMQKPKEEIQTMLMRVYKSKNINHALSSLGLPHKPIRLG